MKVRATLLAIPLIVGTALAQTPPATPPAPAAQTTPAPPATPSAPAEMKTMTYKGVLVDLACGSATSAAPASAAPAAGAPAATAGSADRASGDCSATASSTKLGLKMDDGKVVKFDLVGNQRAQDGLKNNKGWVKNLAANKPLKVKVSGVLQGDKLIASSID
jgi:hypothetical protein